MNTSLVVTDMILAVIMALISQILNPSKLKEFADDKFNFDPNGRRFSKRVENTVGKGEIDRYDPQCFQKNFTADT